ncbi:MAG: hypothetical protein AB7V46_17290 [Thermomicrobiales bacterium]
MARFETGAYRETLAAVDTGGGVVSLANPEGAELYVERLILNITSPSLGACTLDAGIAEGATASSDNLIDGLSAASAAQVADNITNGGSNGKAGQNWGASEFLTVSVASGAAAGIAGTALVHYTLL